MPQKTEKNLDEAVKSLQIADHMTYVTYPLVNEKRLLLKIFDEIYKSIISCINSVLGYEGLGVNDIESLANADLFIEKFARNYGLNNKQIQKLQEIIEINGKHKQSAMEFVKQDKVVILSDNLKTRALDIYRIKEYLLFAKELLMKANLRISE